MEETLDSAHNETLSWEEGAADYNAYVCGELRDGRASKWAALVQDLLSCGEAGLKGLSILDIGCGPGFFPCLFGRMGAHVTGIDTSTQMLVNAYRNAQRCGVEADLYSMDAHQLAFPDNAFDLVVSRNVTWTLVNPRKAYAEWLRVLKPGGRLLIFDANWHLEFYDAAQAARVRANEQRHFKKTGEYFKVCTNDKGYYDSLPLSAVYRPSWDQKALADIGFRQVEVVQDAGRSVYLEWEYELYGASPLFAIIANKAPDHSAPTTKEAVCEATRDYWNKRSDSFGLDGDIDRWGDLLVQALTSRGVNTPKILDAGCGTGAMSLTLASRGYDVQGVDFSAGMLSRARCNANERGLELPLTVGLVDDLPFAAESFDVIVSRNVLSNIAVAEEALACWCKTLKPGGYLMYFDSPWWNFLHDEDLEVQRRGTYGTGSYEHSNVLESLARNMEISSCERPTWDVATLERLGMEVEVARDISTEVWSAEMCERYGFAPQFMIIARKPE